jgi:enamine deaminase RidA (YjgF/YER057c/UK114 family)
VRCARHIGCFDLKLVSASELELPDPPTPFGAYVEAVQTDSLLFLTGMLPTEGRMPKVVGRLGKELDIAGGRQAAKIAALNALAVAKHQLGSLDRVKRVVRLGVYIATEPGFVELHVVADAASEVLLEVFGIEKSSARMVIGVASLPLGVPVELEVILEVSS